MKNKVVIITGASSGIGEACAYGFAKDGAKVVLAARSIDKLNHVKQHCEALGAQTLLVKCDVSIEADCQNLISETIKHFNTIDILVNNAGISMRALFADLDLAVIKQVMDINFWGTVYCTKLALPYILKNNGTIVGVSSIAGYRGLPGRSGYSASKYAVNGWLESLRTELLDSGTNVMWVCPGFTTSNIRNAALDKAGNPNGESKMAEDKMMPADECAQHIAHAIAKRKRTLVLTFTGKRTVLLNKFFPSLADRLVRKFFFKNGELVK